VQVGGHGFPQGLDADRGGVAVMAVLQRLDRGLDDVLGGGEIRLADAEIDDVASLGRKLGRARKHGEGVFLADAVEGRHGLHGVFPGCSAR